MTCATCGQPRSAHQQNGEWVDGTKPYDSITNHYFEEENMDDDEKPVAKLTEVDGNVFSIIGTVAKALRRAGQTEKEAEFRERAFAAPSYDAVLQMVFEYVEVE